MSNAFITQQSTRWFHNATDAHVRTVIGHVAIDVPPGGNLELPRSLAWVIGSRGLRLTEGKNEAADAPMALTKRHTPPPPALPKGVELGELRERAKEESESDEGDGPELEGDDAAADGEDADPIARSVAQLGAAGVDLESLPGGKTKKGHARGVR